MSASWVAPLADPCVPPTAGMPDWLFAADKPTSRPRLSRRRQLGGRGRLRVPWMVPCRIDRSPPSCLRLGSSTVRFALVSSSRGTACPGGSRLILGQPRVDRLNVVDAPQPQLARLVHARRPSQPRHDCCPRALRSRVAYAPAAPPGTSTPSSRCGRPPAPSRSSTWSNCATLPADPYDVASDEVSVTVGEIHHPTDPVESASPKWLSIPARGL